MPVYAKLHAHNGQIVEMLQNGSAYADIVHQLAETHNVQVSLRTFKQYLHDQRQKGSSIADRLEPVRALIEAWRLSGLSVDGIVRKILDNDNIPIHTLSKNSLELALRRWGVRKQKLWDNPILCGRIISLYFSELCTDSDIAEELEHDGFNVIAKDVATIRKQLGIYRRSSNEDWQSEEPRFRALVTVQLQNGQITSLGRGLLHTQLRSEGHNISR
jgi:hypothetical protein